MAIEQRCDTLIRDARAKSGHRTYDYQSGVSQREFVEYLNDASDRLYNLILQERSTLFRRSTTLTCTPGVASVTLPDDIYLQHNINKVDYSPTGNAQDYTPLDARISKEEVSVVGYPDSYFLRDGAIVLSPIPDRAATLRLEFQYVIPQIDLRRAQYSAVSIVGPDLISMTFASLSSVLQETKDDLTGGYVEYICTVNASGTQQAVALPVSSFNATTGVLTFASGTLAADYPGISAGINSHYVVFGKNASTHSSLPQVARRYLVEYAAARVMIRDANALEAALTSQLMQGIEKDVLDAYATLEEDTFQVPVLDYSMLGDDA
jgi:hypothetical protein